MVKLQENKAKGNLPPNTTQLRRTSLLPSLFTNKIKSQTVSTDIRPLFLYFDYAQQLSCGYSSTVNRSSSFTKQYTLLIGFGNAAGTNQSCIYNKQKNPFRKCQSDSAGKQSGKS